MSDQEYAELVHEYSQTGTLNKEEAKVCALMRMGLSRSSEIADVVGCDREMVEIHKRSIGKKFLTARRDARLLRKV